jgi:death-on-curing protein
VADTLFLTLAEVVAIHSDQIHRYGGQAGVRDLGLLQSALAQPEASFAGQWLHGDHYQMAAAYAYHLCQNHPFIDGNKRTALAAALVFLELNGISILDPKGWLKNAVFRIASSKMRKEEFAKLLKKLPRLE